MADVSVRLARESDVPALAELQLTTWRVAYADVLPAAALDALDPAAVEAGWRSAVTAPPDPRAHVLVAVDAGQPVGLTTTAPAGDDDIDPDRWGELGPLVVVPDRRRAGHGSRLLAAAVDHLRDDGFTYAVTWTLATDEITLRFLAAAGWAADGASRALDMAGTPGRELRLATALTG
jgi:GNAT superfamily N-acetyltransferase